MGRRVSRAAARALVAVVGVPGVALALLLAPGAAAAQDPAPGDTARPVAADTVPDARARALQRLRALPVTPIQRDTLAPDTAADPAAAEALADTVTPLVDRLDTVEAVLPDPRRSTPAEAAAGRPAAGPDAVIVREGPRSETVLAADSIVRQLRGLEGYAVTEYRGESAEFEAAGNLLRLHGESRVGRDQRALRTDSLILYRGDRGVVCGYGNPVLTGEGDPLESDVVCYDIERDIGEARGARTQFTQGATWYVRGAENRVYMLTGGPQNRLYGERAEFTSCELPDPHYTFRARSLKMVEGDVMIARNVTLRFEDVPVFWLPWMVQSMKRDRRSGLLTPQFGVNDIVRNSTGYNRHISNLGFYWAINDYMSAQLTGEWFSSNYTSLTGAVSYRWLEQFLSGQITFRQYWQEVGSRQFTINTNNNWQPDERTQISVSGSYASQTDLVRRNSFDPSELNRHITSQGNINRSFDWGRVTLGARRQQSIADERVELTLPSGQISLSPITLFSSADGMQSLTWSGGGRFDRQLTNVRQDTATSARDRERLSAGANHSMNFGRLSFSQSGGYLEELQGRTETADSVLPETQTRQLNWSSSLGYQQDLWTGTSVTPRISVTGDQRSSPVSDGQFVAAPLRYRIGADLRTALYGFWPGAGPFEAIRHKVSPSLSWNYQPKPDGITELQQAVFGLTDLREQNRLTLTVNQTFEAKYAQQDTTPADTADVIGGTGEPRRLPQARKITLLALNTTASPGFTYDFVARRDDGRGFITDKVRNSLRSDLVRGLQLNMSHDLFDEHEPPEEGGLAPRTFAPHLESFDARFSIDQNFWLFRFLGLGVAGGEPDEAEEADAAGSTGPAGARDPSIVGETGPDADARGVGSVIGGPRGSMGPDLAAGGVGGWQASVNYSLVRPRPGAGGDPSQMIRGDLSFRPTEHWSVRWSTGYSLTNAEFSDHFLTLARDLHRWRANFDFIRAQNGNFAMQFRVQLIDNPDLKVDYDQRTDPSRAGRRPGPEGTQ